MVGALLFLFGCWVGAFAGFLLAGITASNRIVQAPDGSAAKGSLVHGREEIADIFSPPLLEPAQHLTTVPTR